MTSTMNGSDHLDVEEKARTMYRAENPKNHLALHELPQYAQEI